MPDREKRKLRKLEEWENFPEYQIPEARDEEKEWLNRHSLEKKEGSTSFRTLPIEPGYEPKLEKLPIKEGAELEIKNLFSRKKKRW